MKRLLLSAVLLSSIGIYAQVGINTTDPKATLDVNGNARIENVEDGTGMEYMLVMGEDKVVKKIALKDWAKGVGLEMFTKTEEGSASKNITRDNCPAGQKGTEVNVSRTEEATASSLTSEEDAVAKARAKATQIATTWIAKHGQAEANKHGVCKQPQVYTATAGPKKETRSVQKSNCGEGLTGTFVNVESPEFSGSGQSTESQSDAQLIANADLTRKLDDWFAGAGQTQANQNGRCEDSRVYDHGAVCNKSTGEFAGYQEPDGTLVADYDNAESAFGGLFWLDAENGDRVYCTDDNQGKYVIADHDSYPPMVGWWVCDYTDDGAAWIDVYNVTRCESLR